MHTRRRLASATAVLASTALVAALAAPPALAAQPATVPTPAHVLVVVMENKDAQQIVGSRDAPYLTSLAKAGANFTDAHAETHPSEPNYLALFSGSTQGVDDDRCPVSFDGANLGSALIAAGHTFAGYSEDLPKAGYTGCGTAGYARKHSPWVDFTDLPGATTNLPAADLGTDWARLPTVAFLTPNLCHDMHDCDVATGDAWAKETLGSYLAWAATNNALLVLTFDESEGDSDTDNHVTTVLAGPMVAPGDYTDRIDHYSLLRTIEDMYGLAPLGASAKAAPITGIWRSTAAPASPSGAESTQVSEPLGAVVRQSGAATRAKSHVN